MSDQWEMFPCQMGDNRAFILYDHGIREEIDRLPLFKLLKVRLKIRHPREDGLPQGDEFDALTAVEDQLEAAFGTIGGVYVGRITTDGYRTLYLYLDVEETAIPPLLDPIRRESGYEIATAFKSDPEKKGYWDELFPTKADWQVIKDQMVLNALADDGDKAEISRRIDHWANFPRQSQCDDFRSWAESEGYIIENTRETDGEFWIQFHHVFSPTFPAISNCTIMLMEKAEACGGTYDGWETSVERG